MRWVILVAALVLPLDSWAVFVQCKTGAQWTGTDIRKCPCCIMCSDGSWHVEGDGTICPTTAAAPARDEASASTTDSEPSYAARTVDGYGACVSEEHFSQWVSALAAKDKPGLEFLVSKGWCFFPKPGLGASILDRTWTGTIKVRLYVGDESLEVWMLREAVETTEDAAAKAAAVATDELLRQEEPTATAEERRAQRRANPGWSETEKSIGFLFAFFWYVAPMLIGAMNRHPRLSAIATVNLFLGWTVIGWIVALGWAIGPAPPRS